MKRLFFFLVASAEVIMAHAQGTVNFINIFGNSVNAPVYMSDGVTPLSGPQFMAELFAGPSQSSLASIATTGFIPSAGGYYNGGTQYINSVLPGTTAWVQVDVWNTASGATFAEAKTSGLPNSWWQSSVFTVITGGGFQGPMPAILTGLGNSPVYLNSVPEPSMLGFLGLGMAVLLLRIRRPG